ncbi:ribonuclease HIII [bacterium E08(2017)]|nr:ribonuclease HIII [bacterium E08(2017)]
MAKKNSFTYKLSPDQQQALIKVLKYGNYRPILREHTIFAAETEKCNIALYTSGKCLVQGKGASEFVTFVLEPEVLKSVGLGYEDLLDPDALNPHMGIDESGKGDFFGPIVIASVYTDEQLTKKMRDMDVKDSKNITSDKKALALGRDLRKLLGKQFSIVKIGPEAYNRLYTKMRNVNTLLSWGHARAIENMLDIVPDCPQAISDQFGRKDQVEKALMKKGSKIELIQRHKAESDMAVAAASILAREAFLRALKDMESKLDIEFPKGASTKVKEAAAELIKKHGPEILTKTSKCHFKTTDEVLAKAGFDRSALGPDGQAVSKTKRS